MRPSTAVVQRSRSGQPRQCRSNAALSAGVSVDGVAGGAGGGAGGVVDGEVVASEPAGVGHRPGLDRQPVPTLAQRDAGLARAVGGIGEHLAALGFVVHQLDTGRAVRGVAG